MTPEEQDKKTLGMLNQRQNSLRERLLETTKRSNGFEKMFYVAGGLAASFTAVGVALIATNFLAAGVAFAAGALFAFGANAVHSKISDAKHTLNILQMDYQIARDDYKDLSLAKMQAQENIRLFSELRKHESKDWGSQIKEQSADQEIRQEKIVPLR